MTVNPLDLRPRRIIRLSDCKVFEAVNKPGLYDYARTLFREHGPVAIEWQHASKGWIRYWVKEE